MPNENSAELREQLVNIFVHIGDRMVEQNAVPRSAFHRDLDIAAINEILELIDAHTAAQVATALDMVLEKAPKDMSMLDGRTYPTAHHRVVGINAANSDWRGAIKVVRVHLITGQNTDQYKCQSYYDDNNVLQDCTCGVCK